MIDTESPNAWLFEDAPDKTKALWWLHGHPHSERFQDPELTTISALIRFNARKHSQDVAFLYPDSASDEASYQTLSWYQLDRIVSAVSSRYSRNLKSLIEEANKNAKQPTVALWADGHTLEYFISEVALAALNVRVLLLADNASIDAVRHLIKVTGTSALMVDSKHAMDTLTVPCMPMEEAMFDDALMAKSRASNTIFDDGTDGWDRPAFIIHSSGSTGLPKPITHTNRSLMQIARMYRLFPDFHIENWFLLFPLYVSSEDKSPWIFADSSSRYHIAGFSIILSGLPNGLTSTFPPRQWPPRSSSILRAFSTVQQMGHPVECLHTAPMVIEGLVQHIESRTGDFSPLSNLKVLQPGGAMLADAVVEKLTAAGVNVKTTYGSTEIGPPFRSIPHSRDNPACYRLANLYPDNDKIKMDEVGPGLYECVVYNGFLLAAELWDGPEDTKPYRTRDLFVQRPPNSGFFYLTGRLDDILVHTNGENTNASPIELDIRSRCPSVRSLVLLGHARPCTSLLVEMHDQSDSDTTGLWTAIEEVNALHPKHSYILRSMVHVLGPDAHLPVTPKGSVKRREAEQMFATTINELYTEEPAQGEVTRSNISSQELRTVINEIVASVLNVAANACDGNISLYDFGLDSIRAIRLRSALCTKVGPISLGEIFESSSLDRLVSYYTKGIDEGSSKEAHLRFMENTVDRCTQLFAGWPKVLQPSNPDKECILLTGATGSLGTALLQSFASSSQIAKVVVLLRGNPDRLSESMTSRDIDMKAICSQINLEILPFDMLDAKFGLTAHDYDRLCEEVTTVIHGAWTMDFNRNVEDFEKDCLQSCVHMARFCATGRTKVFSFVSSVAASMGEVSCGTIEEAPMNADPNTALGTGYAQSKFIVERMSLELARKVGVPVKIFRLGQMYSHTQTGSWNFSEMFPSMIAASIQLGAFPQFVSDRLVDWIPVDIAASAIRDVLLSRNQHQDDNHPVDHATHNIVNPKHIPWNEFAQELQSAVNMLDGTSNTSLELVTIQNWVARLQSAVDEEAQGADVHEFRTHGSKLLNFFLEMAKSDTVSEVVKPPLVFDTTHTSRISPALKNCEAVNRNLLAKCLTRWRHQGYLEFS